MEYYTKSQSENCESCTIDKTPPVAESNEPATGGQEKKIINEGF